MQRIVDRIHKNYDEFWSEHGVRPEYVLLGARIMKKLLICDGVERIKDGWALEGCKIIRVCDNDIIEFCMLGGRK